MKTPKPTKLNLYIFILFIGSINSNISMSQNAWLPPFEASVELEPVEPSIPKSTDCNESSPDFVNRYNRYSFYLENYWIHPIVTIPINFNIWQKDDGSENWQQTSDHLARLNQIVAWLNGWYDSNCVPSDPISGVTDFPDTKIRFELNAVYFYQNTSMWNQGDDTGDGPTLNAAVGAVDPERLNQLNIHIVGGSIPGASGYANSPQYNDAVDHYVVTFNNEALTDGDYVFAGHLAHELAHNLDLQHTYSTSSSPTFCNQSNPDYLDDVFGTGIGVECPHDAGFSCNYNDPGNSCTNNMMGGTKDACYFSPKQIARMHRALALKSIRKYVKCETYPVFPGSTYALPIIIDSDEHWDFDIKFYNPIGISDGGNLTVSCKVIMSNNQNILVASGGKLTVDGGTITNTCAGEFWRGIEVWGNTSQSQFDIAGTNPQGEVLLNNGAIIEHAEVAIRLVKPGDWTSTGGFVRAFNSTFKNNKKDVEFAPYSNDHNGVHYPNKSTFVNSVFYWDDEFRAQIPLGHVTMYRVDGIVFSGCDFYDARDVNDPDYVFVQNNFGIKSIDSKYRVIARCTNLTSCSGDIDDPGSGWDPSTFTNLYYGINASNATNSYAVNVDRCLFTNNYGGIQVSSLTSPLIVRNKFVFDNNPDHYATELQMFGVHLIGSRSIIVEENEFVDNAPNTHRTVGVICSDLGEMDERIYKNTFTRLSYGNYAQGQNRRYYSGISGGWGINGLEFLCNTNSDNRYDHRIWPTLFGAPDPYIDPAYGVKATSGNLWWPTGNSHSNDFLGTPLYEDYYNTSAYGVNYFYHAQQIPDDYSFITAIEATGFSGDLTNLQNQICPSELINYPVGVGKLIPTDKSAYQLEFNNTLNLIQTKEAEHQSNMLNESEITAILLAVDDLEPNNKQSVRDMLNNYSPYLTTEILFEVADNTPSDFNHPWLRDLLLSNIEAVTPELIIFLGTKEFPLPAPMCQEVANAIGMIFTEKTFLEAEIGQLYSRLAFYSNRLILDVQHDTNFVETDSLRQKIIMQNGVLYQEVIIDSYLQDGNLSVAKTEIDNLDLYALSAPAHLRQQINDFVKLKRWMLLVLQVPDKIATLDETNLNFLRDLASDGLGRARYQAQNILCFFYDECPDFFIELDIDQRAHEKTTSEIEANPIQPEFSIYPNPASNWVMIELSSEVFEGLENPEILIIDISGKLIHQTNLARSTYLWETGNIENGIYLITVKSNSTIFQTQKVIVNR